VDRVATWDVSGTTALYVDTGLKEPTWLKWSRSGPQLAIGSAKGGLVLYRKDSRKKLPISGKHSKAILCGDWSRDNKLALGGADNLLTLSSAEGDTLESTELKYAPQSVQFAIAKTGDKEGVAETTVSVNMGGKTVLLYNLRDTEHPVELSFQSRYGSIVKYRWFGDSYVMLAFSEGYVVVVSTAGKELGEEIASVKVVPGRGISDLACSVKAGRAAVAAGSTVRMLDLNGFAEMKAEAASVDAAHGAIESLQWTADGAIVTAATRSGQVYAFLARVPTLVDSHPSFSRVAYMASLREVAIVDAANVLPGSGGAATLASVTVGTEPQLLALGPAHVAVTLNDRAWYYRYASSSGAALVCERSYIGSVEAVKLGQAHAAVLTGGRVYVHALEGSGASGGEATRLPLREEAPRITCMSVAGDFLFLGSAAGTVDLYNLRDGGVLPSAQLRLDGQPAPAIRSVWPSSAGTRVVILDVAGRAFLGNPVEGRLMQVPDVPEGVTGALWDVSPAQSAAGGSRGTAFVLSNASSLATYSYAPVSLTGPSLSPLGRLSIAPNGDMSSVPVATPLPSGGLPIACVDGIVAAYASSSPSGPLVPVVLATHDAIHSSGRVTPDRERQTFCQNVALMRLATAWDAALGLNDQACWLALAGKAMESLDVELAERCYMRLQDAGMVQSLRSLRRVEDRAAVAGHVAVLFGDYALAQDLFVSSSDPHAALDMHKDLLAWDVALRLGESMAPEEVPGLALELARTAEGKGDVAGALDAYKAAAARLDARMAGSGLPPAEAERVKRGVGAGIARTTIKLGDASKGAALALESGDRALCRECSALLEALKLYNEAAGLARAAEMWDKAASLYIAAKNFSSLSGLMDFVSTPKLHSAYAKAKEAGKEWGDALRAYEKARDVGAQVRLLVEHMGAAEKAAALVRATGHAEGAALLAKHCKSVGDTKGAVEFLLLARRREEAFELAGEAGEMGLYVAALRRVLAGAAAAGSGVGSGRGGRAAAGRGTGAEEAAPTSGAAPSASAALPMEECERVAKYYEARGQLGAAGRVYAEAGASGRALKCFLACGEAEIPAAIELAGIARNESITAALLEHLLGGGPDHPAADPIHVRSLYLAVGNFAAAARTALLIAKQEQAVGNYRGAHAVLFGTVRDLEAARAHVPSAIVSALVSLHSYTLVRRLVKAEEHEGAARMALRVARAISTFPAHVVPILTSTVIECQRAGLKKSAFEYACVLMRPEYRESVEERYRKKIEALVRRPSEEEAGEEEAACPFCSASVPAYDLSCGTCKSALPYCIFTGRHMTVDDCTACPVCRFPAMASVMARVISVAARGAALPLPGVAAEPGPLPEPPTCPMCSVGLTGHVVVPMRDPVAFLRRAAGGEEGASTSPDK
jgi:WD repeat-containing protein 19